MSSFRIASSAALSLLKAIPKSHAEAGMRAAVEEAHLVPDGNHSWLYTPSVLAARDYMAKYYVGQYRKTDGSPEETHPIEVADWTVNHVPKELLNKYSQEFIGYVMYCHDIFENYKNENISDFVKTTWKGDPEFKKDTKTVLFLFTDTPGLKGEERLEQQILRANSEDSGLLAIGRYWDKTTAFARDHRATLKGIIPFNGNVEKCFQYTLHRIELITNLKHKSITEEMKESFYTLGDKILHNVEVLYMDNKNPKRNALRMRKKVPSSELH